MNELIEMYKIKSESGKEDKMTEYVSSYLKKLGVSFEVDKYKQVYFFKEETPLICAHMDTVSAKKATVILQDDNWIIGNGNLGADDKNGCYILLKLIEKYRNSISFIFSTEEETCRSNVGENLFYEHQYGLVFDRRNGTNIIGVDNAYCVKKFQKAVHKVGKNFGYHPCPGSFSDCDVLSEFMSCVNLSCGYYNPHTTNEYTNKNEVLNSLKFGDEILASVNSMFAVPFGSRNRRNWHTGSWKYADSWMDTEPNTMTQCYICGKFSDTVVEDICEECYNLYYARESGLNLRQEENRYDYSL